MFEFEVIQELKPNTEILDFIKNYTFIAKNGKIKHLMATKIAIFKSFTLLTVLVISFLQFIEPIEYLITYPSTLTLYEYKVNEISSKTFYIKEYKQNKACLYLFNNINFEIKNYKNIDNKEQMF